MGGGAVDGVVRVSSALESVVVYSSGAVCTRVARLTLPAGGPGPVWVEGLPLALDPHSLRGRVLAGPPGLRVTDVRVDVTAALRRGDDLPALRLDLEDAEDRRARLRERRDRLAAEVAEVASFQAVIPRPRRGDPPRWAPVESILALAGFVDKRLAVLHGRLRDAEDELRRAEHEMDVARGRLDLASSSLHTERAREFATAVLTLVSDGDGSGEEPAEAELAVEYHVPGAAWAPVYQLRLDGAGGGGALVLRACVAQRTGEDWTGVRLGLSTADLMRRADLPELRSLRIGRRQEEPATLGWREPPAGLQELFTGYDAAVRHRPAARAPLPPPAPAPAPPSVELPVAAAPMVQAPPPPGAAPTEGGGGPDWLEEETDRGYGFAPAADAFGGAPPAPAAPGSAPFAPHARQRRARGARPPAAQPAAGPSPLAPAEELLDYARLTLAGPDEPLSRGKLRPARTDSDAVVAEHRRRAESVAALARPAHAVDVRRAAGSFDYRFDTAAPVDVAADGSWHTVPVCEVPVELASEYVCVPGVDQSVYGTVLLTNTSGHALLAGPADVTVDGEFVLTAPLPTLAPGEVRRVGVGVAQSVRVARRTHMRESTAGLRGGTTVLDHTVEIEVANRLPHRALVEVRERVPVATDKDVRIEEHPATPPWTAGERPLDGQDGTYVRGARVWRVELEPGRTVTLTGGYEIRIPAGKALVGGNRRN
jgi:Domain of unknown function (DUF4139)/N-terminal domain of unknown function (DUF4140)